MYRVLFRWHGIVIYSYPAMLYLGLILGIIAEDYVANLMQLDSARVFVATLVLLIPALAGARLLHIATHWEIYCRTPERVWRRSEGGAAMYGGLPVMLAASLPLLHALQIPMGAFWDAATFTILIGMIFTRLGCLLNGCCAGRPYRGRFALCLPDSNGAWKPRIPTQLLEAGWAGLLLIGAIAVWGHAPFRGAVFLSMLMGYGIGRLVFERTRQEQDRIGNLTIHQAISLILIGVSLILLKRW